MEISVSKLAKRILAVAICIVFSSGAYAQNDTLQTQDEYIILNSVNLDEVLVKAQKPVVNVKTDKVVYQVANDEEAKTRTVLEMLRKVPMVTVDGRGNITVNGSSQFKVYVDGRLNTTITRNPTQMLRNMPASNIRNIEVLTNPGAQYDAEGAGGVLYITTKKGGAKQMMNLAEEEAESATQGTVHATAGTKTWGMDASLSAQKNRWSYDMNLNAEYMYSPNTIMESEAIGKDSRQWMSQKSTSKMPFTMGEFGLGCEIDSVSSLHANASVMWFGMKDSGTPQYAYSGGMWGDGMNFSGSQMMKMNEVGFDGSIDYQRTWGKKGRAFFNYQISHTPNQNDSENRYSGLDTSNPLIAEILRNNRSETREKSTSHTLMSDITIPLHENHLLNTGVKMTADRSESDARELEVVEGSFIEDASRSIHFRQHQYIAAAYAEWDARWGWFGMKNGLRYEHTWQDSRYLKGEGSDFKVNYGALVPSVSLTANANESNNFGLQYTMRIRRPRINELDPYINRADPTQLSYGNPHLDAQHLHHAAFVYTLSKSKLALRMSLNHSWSNDGITQYSKLADPSTGLGQVSRIHTTYGNLSKNRTTSLNGFISWGIFSTTRLTVSGEVGYSDMRSAEIEAHNYGWHGECNAGLQQELPWGIKWNTNVEWMSRRQTLQGYESGMTMLSTTLSRSFCKDRLNVSLSGMTGLGHGGKMVWKSVTKSKDFTNTSRYIDNMQDITIGISWTFGGTKAKLIDEPMPMDFEESGNGGGKSMRMRHRR